MSDAPHLKSPNARSEIAMRRLVLEALFERVARRVLRKLSRDA